MKSFLTTRQAKPNIVEVGCGDGQLGVKLAEAGAFVVACDQVDNLSQAAKEMCAAGHMVATIKPMQRLTWDELPNPVHGFVGQRSLHWLRHKEAAHILSKIADRMPDGPPSLSRSPVSILPSRRNIPSIKTHP
ncbi:MAG: class I SAM-dependent methyltransferase [Pseudomonadota bacterium]|nr:class I SAM-dependent methyltransferase [Pseudomonadota bacterium]